MNPAKCVVPNRDVVVRNLNGERVLLNLKNGVCYGLDPVGATVWEQLESGRTLEWLAGFVSGKYQLDPDLGMSDLLSFTHDLREHGLIEVI
jgi:Coenzyme PQQ synthesis protein D (PqqD)